MARNFIYLIIFCGKMIRVLCTKFANSIKDLEMHLSNLNLPLRKSTIWFELLAEKKEISK